MIGLTVVGLSEVALAVVSLTEVGLTVVVLTGICVVASGTLGGGGRWKSIWVLLRITSVPFEVFSPTNDDHGGVRWSRFVRGPDMVGPV